MWFHILAIFRIFADGGESYFLWKILLTIRKIYVSIILTYFVIPKLYLEFGQTGLSKQCRPRSNAAELRGVSSGYGRFATNTVIM